jgi:hypothetical protein
MFNYKFYLLAFAQSLKATTLNGSKVPGANVANNSLS